MTNSNIISEPADKGSSIVIMNRYYCINEGMRQLNDNNFYEETMWTAQDNSHMVNSYVNDMLGSVKIF